MKRTLLCVAAFALVPSCIFDPGPTASPTGTPPPSATLSATATSPVTPIPSATPPGGGPTPAASATPGSTPASTNTPGATASATATATPGAGATASPTAGSTPTSGPTPTPTATPTPDPNVSAGDFGTPTNAEQLMLELVNRARKDPPAEAVRLGLTSVDEGVPPGQISDSPQPPLAMHALITTAARGHSQDMLDRNFFAHNNPDGDTPFARMLNAGYVFSTAGENIAFQGTTGPIDEDLTTAQLHDDLFIDAGIADRGHRVNILSPNFKEIGLGVRTGSFTDPAGTTFNAVMATQDFATAAASSAFFVLGVVYDDADGDGFYDAGEGLGNVTVRLGGVPVTTPGSGGYAFRVIADAAYPISFSGGPLAADITGTVTTAGVNKKVDAIAGGGLSGDDP